MVERFEWYGMAWIQSGLILLPGDDDDSLVVCGYKTGQGLFLLWFWNKMGWEQKRVETEMVFIVDEDNGWEFCLAACSSAGTQN